jgi:large subunit ribosomal protein L4
MVGNELRTMELAASLFAVPANASLISEVLVSALANRRHPIADTKTRGEVRGGGRKPWRQKGTGRARQGSTRAPHWRHGGVVFGPTSERNFTRKINRRARRAVMAMLLSDLVRARQLRLVDALNGTTVTSTKRLATFLNGSAGSARRPLLLTGQSDPGLLRAARNLPRVAVRSLDRLGLVDLATTDQMFLDPSALEPLTTKYGVKQGAASHRSSAEPTPLPTPEPPAPVSAKRTPKRARPRTTTNAASKVTS